MPFLDHDVVDFATRVCRARYKLRDGVGKRVLKKAAEPYLDHDMIYRRKQGFGAPMEEWFREGDFGAALPRRVRALGAAHAKASSTTTTSRRLLKEQIAGRGGVQLSAVDRDERGAVARVLDRRPGGLFVTPGRYLYIHHSLHRTGVVDTPLLDGLTERHKVDLEVPPLVETPDIQAEMARAGCTGAVLEMNEGCPGRIYLKLAARLLRAGYRPFFYWPRERAVEAIDRERISSYWRLWALVKVSRRVFKRNDDRAYATQARIEIEELIQQAKPGAVCCAGGADARPALTRQPASTCAPTSGRRSCPAAAMVTPVTWRRSWRRRYRAVRRASWRNRFPLLDEFGVASGRHADPPGHERPRRSLVFRGDVALLPDRLKSALRALRAGLHLRAPLPRQLFGGARQPRARHPVHRRIQRLGNLDEPQLQRHSLRYEDVYHPGRRCGVPAGDADHRRVEVVKDSLVARGVDAAKILVNPNGADPDAYAPASPAEKRTHSSATAASGRRPGHRLHRNIWRLAWHRRAGRGDSRNLPAAIRARSSC